MKNIILICILFLLTYSVSKAQQSSNITFSHAGKTVRGTITVPSGAGAFHTMNDFKAQVDQENTEKILQAFEYIFKDSTITLKHGVIMSDSNMHFVLNEGYYLADNISDSLSRYNFLNGLWALRSTTTYGLSRPSGWILVIEFPHWLNLENMVLEDSILHISLGAYTRLSKTRFICSYHRYLYQFAIRGVEVSFTSMEEEYIKGEVECIID